MKAQFIKAQKLQSNHSVTSNPEVLLRAMTATNEAATWLVGQNKSVAHSSEVSESNSRLATNAHCIVTPPTETSAEVGLGSLAAAKLEPSRLCKMKHMVGFRKYNRMHDISSSAMQVYENIALLLQGREDAINLALQQIDSALDCLRQAELHFFRQCDQIIQFERKSQELDFLKSNLESYIKKSIELVDVNLQEQNTGKSPSTSSIEKAMDLQWLDHNQFRALANDLKSQLSNPEGIRSTKHANVFVASTQAISQVMQNTVELCMDFHTKSPLKRLASASVDFEVMRDYYFNRLLPAEASLNRAVQEQQAVLNSLLFIALDARSTVETLNSRAQEIAASNRINNNSRDVVEEERVLMDFVRDCRKYEREQLRSIRHKGEDTGETDSEFIRFSSVTRPATKIEVLGSENMGSTSPTTKPSPPVWAQSWAGTSPKILRHRIIK